VPAHYVGMPRVEFLPNGREVRLIEGYAFSDAQELLWSVPAQAVVDGASIPSIFWSVIGGPFEGKYRDASIIHDWFCDTRLREWQATHRVFYEAMLVSEVPRRTAKVMYLAVRWGGPRWETRVSKNMEVLVEYLHYQYRDLVARGFRSEEVKHILKESVGQHLHAHHLGERERTDLIEAVMTADNPRIWQLLEPTVISLDSPAKKLRRPVRIDDFSDIMVRLEQEDISLDDIDNIADHFALAGQENSP
jgi:Protein of unknown function (DUF1353)